MDQKAAKLRACATEARAVARSLGPYLDDAVSKAAPRAADMSVGFGDAPGGGSDAIWLGPFADQCTNTLQQRRGTLGRMATALMADANRWENEASRLESDSKAAKAKDKAAKTAAGGH
ncbi:hypothetical protein AB0M29_15580 [Streptomyces sp. NPDC051976]|uniref:hypothetical protein n=1 Tax=Streptomyces sp. NPDC051976 TaxID=3154947 RepID=UPI003441254C